MSEAYIFPFAVVVVVWLVWLTVRPRKYRIPQTLLDDVAANKSDCDELHRSAIYQANSLSRQTDRIEQLTAALDGLLAHEQRKARKVKAKPKRRK